MVKTSVQSCRIIACSMWALCASRSPPRINSEMMVQVDNPGVPRLPHRTYAPKALGAPPLQQIRHHLPSWAKPSSCCVKLKGLWILTHPTLILNSRTPIIKWTCHEQMWYTMVRHQAIPKEVFLARSSIASKTADTTQWSIPIETRTASINLELRALSWTKLLAPCPNTNQAHGNLAKATSSANNKPSSSSGTNSSSNAASLQISRRRPRSLQWPTSSKWTASNQLRRRRSRKQSRRHPLAPALRSARISKQTKMQWS